jgi:hypothetical protein
MSSIQLNLTDVSDRIERETPRQHRFRQDMQLAGFRVQRYSGRGTNGADTYGGSTFRAVQPPS